MNHPSAAERKAMRARYSPPKSPLTFTVVHCGKVVFEGPAGLCAWWAKENGLTNAKTKAVYGNK